MKVISIESNNINDFENVIQEMPAFVKIFSPNCSHCTSMAPAWDALKYDNSIKNLDFALVAINSSAIDEMKCPGVKSFNGVPTMREIKKGTGEAGKEYSGSRTKEAMADFIRKTFNKRSSTLKRSMKRKTKGGDYGCNKQGGKRRKSRKFRKSTRKSRRSSTRKY
jgi:hypothetical protein